MTIQQQENKLQEIESLIKPEMYETFGLYIKDYRKLFIQEFGEAKAGEPDFIKEVRDFLEIDHESIEQNTTADGTIDFQKAKNEKLLSNYYYKAGAPAQHFSSEISNINMEAVAAYVSNETENAKDTSFVGRMQQKEYDKLINALGNG